LFRSEPLDDYEAALLRREAIDRVLNRLSEAADEPLTPEQEACRWWGTEQGYDALAGHLDHLLQHQVDAADIIKAHAAMPPIAARIEARWNGLPAVRQLREQEDELRRDLQQIIDTIEDLEKSNSTEKAFQAESINLLNLLDEEPDRAGQLDFLKNLQLLLIAPSTGKPRGLGRMKDEVADLVAPLQEGWKDALGKFNFDEQAERCALEAADRLACLLAPVSEEFAHLCGDANRYDFTTLARHTRDLLAGSPALCKQLQERLLHVLVDEFQDTNQLQWEIVSRIVGAGPDGPLESARLFVVGDPQQSIYRFRDADVGVFKHVQERIRADNARRGLADVPTCHDETEGTAVSTSEQRLGLMPLGANYRSLSPLPLALVDRVFRYVFDPGLHGLDPENHRFEVLYQPLEAGTENKAVGEVRYIIPDEPPVGAGSDESGEPEQDDGEAERSVEDLGLVPVQALVDQLVDLHGQPKLGADAPVPLRWSDMAILLPSRTMVLTQLEEELRGRGVPFVVTGGIGFWQRQEVSDVINLACCLADRGDELALFAMLRGPLGQLHDAEILFLSQLGLGSLERGLRMIRLGGDDLRSAANEADADWLRGRWSRLSAEVQAVLQAYWNDLEPGRRGRMVSTATLLDGWRQRVDRMAHADLLQRALEEAGSFTLYAAAADGDIALANLTRCFDQVRALEARAALDLNRLARRLRELRDDSPREEQATLARGDAVQIMTVHAAKGLEFPVVAVMKMERRADRAPFAPLMVMSPSDRLLGGDADTFRGVRPGTLSVRLRHPGKPREPYYPLLLKALQRLDRAQQLAESRRLFYVAATRAQERLLLVGKEPGFTKKGERRTLPTSWQLWFERALEMTEEQKKIGVWQDEAAGQCVTIIRETTGVRPAEPTIIPSEPARIDLAYVHEFPLHPVVATTSLEKMRELWHTDRHAWWLRYRVQLQPFVPKAQNVFT
ncbi:MAG: UvrD-helicase domain-containing protein, partial [Gemmataceae bacterium]